MGCDFYLNPPTDPTKDLIAENKKLRDVLERWRHAAVLTDTPLMTATCEALGYIDEQNETD